MNTRLLQCHMNQTTAIEITSDGKYSIQSCVTTVTAQESYHTTLGRVWRQYTKYYEWWFPFSNTEIIICSYRPSFTDNVTWTGWNAFSKMLMIKYLHDARCLGTNHALKRRFHTFRKNTHSKAVYWLLHV